MATPDFVIDLGNGVYLDSAGRLAADVPNEVARFSMSAPLPVPGAAVHQVFDSIGSVVPQLNNVGALLLKDLDAFEALGLSAELAKTFGKVADIAKTLGSCIPYVNIAVGLLNMLGAFNGADPMRDLIVAEFNRLFARLDQDRRDALNDYTGDCIAAFSTALTQLADYQTVLAKPKAYRGPGELSRKRNGLLLHLPHVQERLTSALLHTWALPLDRNQYSNHWSYLQDILHTIPKAGPPAPARFPAEAVPFDHRPMVQLLTFGLQTYLTLIKSIIPEHRTTGQFHAVLLDLADKLSPSLDKMRAETLARTIYASGFPYFRVGLRQFYVLEVGAMDLRADTDDYMLQTIPSLDHPLWEHAGNLWGYWTLAPAVPMKGDASRQGPDIWWSINPASVTLANEQSERDYAALLARSGYFTLAHLEALLRHLSTEPNRSETVTGSADTYRRPRPAFPVTVRSAEIPFSTPIEVTASREPQDCKAYVTLTTQPFGQDESIGYRIRLLTLPNGRTETPFEWYAWPTYVPVAGTRNWNLQMHRNDGLPLDPVGQNERLLQDRASPEQPVQQSGTLRLTADTFDWFVPVPDNPILVDYLREDRVAAFRSFRTVGPAPLPSPPPAPSPAGPPAVEDRIVALKVEGRVFGGLEHEPEDEPEGERRDWLRTDVELTYQIYWHDDAFSITLTSHPEDRNFVVYVVVEEYLARSGQWLPTPVVVRFNGQLTYVPQSLFDAEATARQRANGIISRIEHNYSISHQPRPGDPVIGWLRPGVLKEPEAMVEFVQVAMQHAPAIVEKAIAEAANDAEATRFGRQQNK